MFSPAYIAKLIVCFLPARWTPSMNAADCMTESEQPSQKSDIPMPSLHVTTHLPFGMSFLVIFVSSWYFK